MDTYLVIGLAVLLAHLLYDFHWQGPFVADMKGKSDFILFVHAATWALLIYFVLMLFGEAAWWKLGFLLVTHFAIDRWKARLPREPGWFWAIYVDQGLHLVTMIVVLW